MKYSKPFILKEEVEFRKDFLPNQTYKFDFEIEMEEECENCELKIIEMNQYFVETELSKINIDKKTGNYTTDITTTDNIYYLKLNLTNNDNKKVIIKKCYINNKEYIFSYKYIPKVLSRLITTFSLKDDSIIQRTHFYKNCLKIAKDSPIIGHGGNAWKYLQKIYQDYPYDVKETHSYFFELLISYGIIGVLAFFTIIILLTIEFIKNIKKDKELAKKMLSVAIGLGVLIIHSLCFDFHMSFLFILIDCHIRNMSCFLYHLLYHTICIHYHNYSLHWVDLAFLLLLFSFS